MSREIKIQVLFVLRNKDFTKSIMEHYTTVERLMSGEDVFNYETGNEIIAKRLFTGLTDSTGKDYYIGDIGQFDNGDKFELCMEDWLEVYVNWIDEPECEDQARDLYRISQAKIIGNIHQHPELVT